jgi:hypothetical protein
MGASAFIAGFIFSFYWGWVFGFILLAAFPFLAAMGSMMGVAMQSGISE